MARFDRMKVLNRIYEIGVVPVFYHSDVAVAQKVVAACAAGGAGVVEFTNRGDFAPQAFLELSHYVAQSLPEVILGVGSVVDAPTAALYIAYGASFVVGPVLNPEVARLCNRRKVAYSPGCGSTSEIAQAEELGAEIVKVFPGTSVGGPDFVRSVLGPCPWTRIMPTGGVDATEASIRAWLGAGAACLGMGSNLITKELVAAGDWEGLTRKVAQVIGWVRAARGQSLFAGVEHVGLHPNAAASGEQIVQWYVQTFGFRPSEGNTSYFVSGSGPGRIEIMKAGQGEPCHVAIRVADFEAALEALRAIGVDVEEPRIKPDVKAVFLRDPDPAGNRVHLLWRAGA
jgi:2-dehydro-3-deoxyphosphogluconate aldolase/(4S)-4-hydroxy-2-oxoglutarate aldolase